MAYNIDTASHVSGLTLRQIRHWERRGLLKPSVQRARGRGSRRLYSFSDLVELRLLARLRESGISLQRIAVVMRHVRKHVKLEPGLGGVSFLTDGKSVLVRSDDVSRWEDALRGGQVVWTVPIAEAWNEADVSLRSLAEPRTERVVVGRKSYEVTLKPDLEEGGWVVECLELPGCISEGSSPREARAMIRDAIRGWEAVARDAKTVRAAR